MNKDVLALLVKAQIASDGGKKIEDLKIYDEEAWRRGYWYKDDCIINAIYNIERKKCKNISYYIKYSHNWVSRYQTNLYMFVIYFNFKINGKANQMSFHYIAENKYDIEFLLRRCNNSSHKTRWKGVEGSCRTTALQLIKEEKVLE